jgi:hypothetical protein
MIAALYARKWRQQRGVDHTEKGEATNRRNG